LTDTHQASLLLVDPKTNELRFKAATGNTPILDIVVPSNSIAGWIVQHNQPLILNDVQSDKRFYTGVDNAMGFETRDMLGVPLNFKDNVIGALEVINKKDSLPYTAQDLVLMEALASQAAVAIENARLFEQSDLVAEIMHELKTPLMAIISASELLLRQNRLAKGESELIELVSREAGRMSKLTTDFLDLARIESGRYHLKNENVALDEIIDEVVRLMKPHAASQDIKITSTVPGKVPPMKGDRDRLQQVLLNLVSNAIKYNVTGGKVGIGLTVEPEYLVVTVKDTGIGLSVESLGKLFTRFYRDPEIEKSSEGSGLGLTIAKKIVEQHGGNMAVSSKPGRGSAFSCRFPL
jgi:signal transduction histidine kinase